LGEGNAKFPINNRSQINPTCLTVIPIYCSDTNLFVHKAINHDRVSEIDIDYKSITVPVLAKIDPVAQVITDQNPADWSGQVSCGPASPMRAMARCAEYNL
jgi:hypothetical protein